MAQKTTPQSMVHRELQGSFPSENNELRKTIRTNSCRIWNLIKRYKSQGTLREKSSSCISPRGCFGRLTSHRPPTLSREAVATEMAGRTPWASTGLVLKELPLCVWFLGHLPRGPVQGPPFISTHSEISQEWGSILGGSCWKCTQVQVKCWPQQHKEMGEGWDMPQKKQVGDVICWWMRAFKNLSVSKGIKKSVSTAKVGCLLQKAGENRKLPPPNDLKNALKQERKAKEELQRAWLSIDEVAQFRANQQKWKQNF